MSKKNLKLIMELIFIFILPLLFMCFTTEIQVERNFEYDNNGNYETSQETKNLSFDNSIIKYNKDLSYNNINISNELIYINNHLIFKEGYQLYIDNPVSISGIITLYSEEQDYKYLLGFDIGLSKFVLYSGYYENYVYQFDATYSNNTITFLENIDFSFIIQDYGSLYNFDLLFSSFTIWGNIKNIVIEYLDVNDNVLLDILLCYLFFWFFMFLIWHTFYRFFDWIFHLSFTGGKDNG